MFADEIILVTVKEIKSVNPLLFSVVCEGTRDILGLELKSVFVLGGLT